jgi:FkbM family methyltransferase
MKNLINRILGKMGYKDPTTLYQLISYSQEAEDLIVQEVLGHPTDGFYIDIGAHHPYRFSNTALFYKKGWRGINVEPNPDALTLFQQERLRDINISAGASGEASDALTYYSFVESALNTFDETMAQHRIENNHSQLIEKISVPTLMINDIFAQADKHVDFLSIDIEGMEYSVLSHLDFTKYRPTVIIVELLETSFTAVFNDPVYQLLIQNSYELVAHTPRSYFFASK